MKYNISKNTPPAMQNLGIGTEFITFLHSQVSKNMQQSITPMFFSILGAHISGAEFMYSDLSWKESCGILVNLVAGNDAGKGQLSASRTIPKASRSREQSKELVIWLCRGKSKTRITSKFVQKLIPYNNAFMLDFI